MEAIMEISFFMAMKPPACTHQEKKVRVVKGKPVLYEPENVKAARQKLRAYLSQHRPESPFAGPVRLTTWWCFPISGKHKDGEYKTSRPDTVVLIYLNATQVAIRAGYSVKTADQQASRMLTNVKVQQAISEKMADRSKRTGVNQDRIVMELAKIAFTFESGQAPWQIKPETNTKMSVVLLFENETNLGRRQRIHGSQPLVTGSGG